MTNSSSSSSSYIIEWSSSSSSYFANLSSSSSSYVVEWSSSTSSSSLSSHDYSLREFRGVDIIQNNNTLLPFSWIGEQGTISDLGDDSVLSFIIQSSQSPILDYEAIVDRDNNYLTQADSLESNVYIPDSIQTYYQHDSDFYIDIIAKDQHGIESVRTHVEPNAYEFEDIEGAFYIPKFTWDNFIPINSNTVSTTTIIDFDTVWLGNEEGWLKEVHLTLEELTEETSTQYSSRVDNLIFNKNGDKLLVSTQGNLYSYSVGHYLNAEDFEISNSVSNEYNMAVYGDDYIWTTDSYNGKVFKMDWDFITQKTYTGIDAPYKIIKSDYHNSYFVVSDRILWRISDLTSSLTVVYEVDNHRIIDMSISPQGYICLLLSGDTYYIRVLDNDLYGLLLDYKTTDSLRYCTYCNEGRFYILSELNTDTIIYSTNHYIFNVETNEIYCTKTEVTPITTTTTTTYGVTSKAVEVKCPNGGETIGQTQEYEVKWIASEGITDLVKIDLYKDDIYYSTIEDDVPNTGIYKWVVGSNLESSNFYKIRVTWKSVSSDPNNYDESNNYFAISKTIPTTTTTTTTKLTEYAVGIGYDNKNDRVIIALRSGLLGIFALDAKSFYGLFDSNLDCISCMAVKNVKIYSIDDQTKARVFVGSQEHYSDKWDSGEIETELKSIYYGGGNNLEAGKKYYVHIQTYSEKRGWSEIQVKSFIMPVW